MRTRTALVAGSGIACALAIAAPSAVAGGKHHPPPSVSGDVTCSSIWLEGENFPRWSRSWIDYRVTDAYLGELTTGQFTVDESAWERHIDWQPPAKELWVELEVAWWAHSGDREWHLIAKKDIDCRPEEEQPPTSPPSTPSPPTTPEPSSPPPPSSSPPQPVPPTSPPPQLDVPPDTPPKRTVRKRTRTRVVRGCLGPWPRHPRIPGVRARRGSDGRYYGFRDVRRWRTTYITITQPDGTVKRGRRVQRKIVSFGTFCGDVTPSVTG